MWNPVSGTIVFVAAARVRVARPALPASSGLSLLYYSALALAGAPSVRDNWTRHPW